jgi:hypothetical protein
VMQSEAAGTIHGRQRQPLSHQEHNYIHDPISGYGIERNHQPDTETHICSAR